LSGVFGQDFGYEATAGLHQDTSDTMFHQHTSDTNSITRL
jgi:hypothetical protein